MKGREERRRAGQRVRGRGGEEEGSGEAGGEEGDRREREETRTDPS